MIGVSERTPKAGFGISEQQAPAMGKGALYCLYWREEACYRALDWPPIGIKPLPESV